MVKRNLTCRGDSMLKWIKQKLEATYNKIFGIDDDKVFGIDDDIVVVILKFIIVISIIGSIIAYFAIPYK